MTNAILCLDEPEIDTTLDDLAHRLRAAENTGIRLITRLGKPAERLLGRLPAEARAPLEAATYRALGIAMDVASGSRGVVGDQKGWVTTATAGATGALGGFGGWPTALAEVPVSVTVMMRGVQAIAAEHGHDPDEEQTRKDCLLAFAASGPLVRNASGDLEFLAARATLSGQTVQTGLSLAAPRLAGVLGRKLAAQAVPVLGAATAAAINVSYARYYSDVARVVFGLRRLARDSAEPFDTLSRRLAERVANPLRA